MESNGFMIGPGITEIGAIKVVLSTAGHPVVLHGHAECKPTLTNWACYEQAKAALEKGHGCHDQNVLIEMQLSRCVAKRQSSKPRESSGVQISDWVRLQVQCNEKKTRKKTYFFYVNILIFFGRGQSPTCPQQSLKV